MTSLLTCALCQESRPLRDGHIVPRFAVHWLKQTSATGRLRSADSPNRRVQDGARRKMLCAACEQRFSQWENVFSSQIFKPFVEARATSFDYGDWLLKFVVSVGFRAAIADLAVPPAQHQAKAPVIESMLGHWRAYLLGEGDSTPSSEHYLLFLDVVTEHPRDVDLPEHINWYFLRAFDACLFHGAGTQAVHTYAKLPEGIVLISAIDPPVIEGLDDLRVVSSSRIGVPQRVLNEAIGSFLVSRAEKTSKAVLGSLSARQLSQIDRSYQTAWPQWVGSHGFYAGQADEILRRTRRQKDGR